MNLRVDWESLTSYRATFDNRYRNMNSKTRITISLQELDESPVAEVEKKSGVDATAYTRCKRFGKRAAVDAKRLREVETENEQLKKLLAERDLELQVMKESAQKKC
jgi:putative transposase